MKFGQYGLVAISAYELMQSGKDPRTSWNESAQKILSSVSAQKKQCPKNAFLGLVEKEFTKSKNAMYAKQALVIINQIGVENLGNIPPSVFWHTKMVNVPKHYNGQIDVVFALKSKGYI